MKGQESVEAILSALNTEDRLSIADAIKVSQIGIQGVSGMIGRNVSPYKDDGSLIGGIDARSFDESEYLADRLIAWRRRNEKNIQS